MVRLTDQSGDDCYEEDSLFLTVPSGRGECRTMEDHTEKCLGQSGGRRSRQKAWARDSIAVSVGKAMQDTYT